MKNPPSSLNELIKADKECLYQLGHVSMESFCLLATYAFLINQKGAATVFGPSDDADGLKTCHKYSFLSS